MLKTKQLNTNIWLVRNYLSHTKWHIKIHINNNVMDNNEMNIFCHTLGGSL